MGTAGWVILGVAVVAGGGAVAWWIHSASKATPTPAATNAPAPQAGSSWVSTVTGVAGAANAFSSAFENVTSGISNLTS